eukprot:TRINITY_DN2467_c0_g1_i2.p1 TRINITY_DN2467_c0_g1~~TRINITY_DN2467_c0_g1_i2.p1  ORF type:complete len:576 (+),score=141.57 TRINITY_DN2467_c0_g1_i2:109-1728(+)
MSVVSSGASVRVSQWPRDWERKVPARTPPPQQQQQQQQYFGVTPPSHSHRPPPRPPQTPAAAAWQSASRVSAAAVAAEHTAAALGRLQRHDEALGAEIAALREANAALRAVAEAPPLCTDGAAAEVLARCGCVCGRGGEDASPRFVALCEMCLDMEAAERAAVEPLRGPLVAAAAARRLHAQLLRGVAQQRLPSIDWAAVERGALASLELRQPLRPAAPPPSAAEGAAGEGDAWSPRRAGGGSSARSDAAAVLRRAEQLSAVARRAAVAASPRRGAGAAPARPTGVPAAEQCQRCAQLGAMPPPGAVAAPNGPFPSATAELRQLRAERAQLRQLACGPRGVPPPGAPFAEQCAAADVAERRRGVLAAYRRLGARGAGPSSGGGGGDADEIMWSAAAARLRGAVVARGRAAAERMAAQSAADEAVGRAIRGLLTAVEADAGEPAPPAAKQAGAAAGRAGTRHPAGEVPPAPAADAAERPGMESPWPTPAPPSPAPAGRRLAEQLPAPCGLAALGASGAGSRQSDSSDAALLSVASRCPQQ